MNTVNVMNSGSNITINRIVIRQFIEILFTQYVHLWWDDDESPTLPTKGQMCAFMETILTRSQISRGQFKQVCCLLMKFMNCCHTEYNYMRHLRFNVNKLIVVTFILSEPNTSATDIHRLVRREQCYEKYARITGLTTKELTQCCSIVRPIIVRKAKLQKLRIRGKNSQDYCTNGYLLPVELQWFNSMMRTLLKHKRNNG